MRKRTPQFANPTWSRQSCLLHVAGALVLLLSTPATFAGDVETQGWANLTLGWNHSEKLYYELDLSPKLLVSGDPKWRSFDVSPTVEYYPNDWIDVVGEGSAGTTLQDDDLRTNELTLAAGLRTHFVKNVVGPRRYERTPLGRSNIASYFRLEQRNFWYSDDTDSAHSARFRARLELKTPLNGKKLSDDGNIYLMADVEGFVKLDGEIDERYATKYRGRVGVGYRIDSKHRFDVLYVVDRVRNTIDETPRDTLQAFDVRYRIIF